MTQISRYAHDLAGAAAHHGHVCGLAAQSQRDLGKCAAAYPELFPGSPFDATLFNAVALANAFGSPELTADDLRVANRTSLWIFAVDWLIDHRATSAAEVDGIVGTCLAVADGGAAQTPLTRFLADIRDELSQAPAFDALRPVWREELQRMLRAMAREWTWKSGGPEARPTLADYLDNADNFGSSFVNVSHWIRNAEPGGLARLEDLRAASGQVQRVLRLLNDLATHHRDLSWGDLNALMLGVGRAEVVELIGGLVDHAQELLDPPRDECPAEVAYLQRQIGYSSGFYGITDYWGDL